MAVISLSSLDWFTGACLLVAVVMLCWDTIEVGRNDAANLLNAVFGARVLSVRRAVLIAGLAVVCGAVLSSDVIDTARKGIFDPTRLATNPGDALSMALAIYTTVYIVDTVLLYGYSAFGMPVSTTATLVFSLLGAALAINHSTVNWNKAGWVLGGIVCSIILSGIASFLIQRAARGAIRDRTTNLQALLLHGGWIGGGMAAGLCYFLLLKGMKDVELVKTIKEEYVNELGSAVVVLFLWGAFSILIHLLLVFFRERAAKLLFPVLAVLGMVAMAFAFGQNDLANCASPGLAVYHLIEAGDVRIGTDATINRWLLLLCGGLLFLGMTTKNARRVTKAAASAGSMGDHVKLWAPRWCLSSATFLLKFSDKTPALAPRRTLTDAGETKHYDALRACVIMSVSASVIATASSMGLPVSTTYVSFAAIVATGMADRIFQRGDAELKLGRSIWVVSSWFLAAAIAMIASGLIATTIYYLEVPGIAVCLAANLLIRHYLKKRAIVHHKRIADEASERAHPDEYALEDEEV